MAALRDHVGIAAGIFLPAPLPFPGDHAGHGAVEEVAVVADQDHGAGIVRDQFLQQVERLEVEVVGRFVQHQQVRRAREGACEHQPPALPARERRERRARLLGREQEVLHVADHVARLPAHMHLVAAPFGQCLGQGDRGIEARALLVEPHHLEPGAQAHLARIRGQHAGQHVEQRGLARAVRAHDADAVAADDAGGEIPHDEAFAIGLGDALGRDDEVARPGRLARGHAHPALRAHAFAPLRAQRVQVLEPPDIALAPRRHAVAQPVFLPHDLARELVRLALLVLQDLVAPFLEMREAAFEPPRRAAIQPDHRARQAFEEAPVMADQHQGGIERGQFPFQPFDRRQVEMVGGFVQQQDVGTRRERAREGGAARLPARERGGRLLAGHAELFQQVARAVMVVRRAEPRLDIGEDGREGREVRLLFQVAQRGAGLEEARPALGLDDAGGDLQQRGLARPVAPDEREALPGCHGQARGLEQAGAAEAVADIGQEQERRGRHAHHPAKGSRIMMVSSRSGLVLSSTIGASTSSSMRRTYFTASAGSSA